MISCVFEVAVLQCFYLRMRIIHLIKKKQSLTTHVRSNVLNVLYRSNACPSHTLPVATMIPGTDFLLVIGPDV